MAAAKKDIKIYQGETFTMSVQWKDGNNTPVDLTGYTGSMKVKPSYGSNTIFANATITFEESDGTINILIPAATTNSIPTANSGSPPRATYHYDLFVESSTGISIPLLYGAAIFQGRV